MTTPPSLEELQDLFAKVRALDAATALLALRIERMNPDAYKAQFESLGKSAKEKGDEHLIAVCKILGVKVD